MKQIPRGVRNNNPGNIDYNKANKWVGQIGIETGVPNPRFAVFDTPENGIRAIAKLLIGYHKKGFTTVRQMINRWAPPVENDTGAYAKAVADKLGVDQTLSLTLSHYVLMVMTSAIIKHENGYAPYNLDVIREGVSRAMK